MSCPNCERMAHFLASLTLSLSYADEDAAIRLFEDLAGDPTTVEMIEEITGMVTSKTGRPICPSGCGRLAVRIASTKRNLPKYCADPSKIKETLAACFEDFVRGGGSRSPQIQRLTREYIRRAKIPIPSRVPRSGCKNCEIMSLTLAKTFVALDRETSGQQVSRLDERLAQIHQMHVPDVIERTEQILLHFQQMTDEIIASHCVEMAKFIVSAEALLMEYQGIIGEEGIRKVRTAILALPTDDRDVQNIQRYLLQDWLPQRQQAQAEQKRLPIHDGGDGKTLIYQYAHSLWRVKVG